MSIDKRKVYGIEENVYCSWRQNPRNATNADVGKPCSIDSFYVTKALYNDRQKLGMANNNSYYEYILRMVLLSAKRIDAAPEEIKKAHFFAFCDFIIKNFRGYKANKKMKYLEKSVMERNYNMFCTVNRFL